MENEPSKSEQVHMHSHFNILYQDVFSWIEPANDTGVPEEADAHDEERGKKKLLTIVSPLGLLA